MKKILLLLLLLLPAVAAQEQILKAEVVLFPDGNAILRSLQPSVGTPDEQNPLTHDFSLRVQDYQTSFPIDFTITDPPTKVDSMLIVSRLPYTDTGMLEVLYQNEVIMSYDLSELCNANNRCDNFENYLSCPDDCPLPIPDGICVPAEDTICDPDCDTRTDLDCIEQEVKRAFLAQPTALLIILIIAGIGIPLAAILYRAKRK